MTEFPEEDEDLDEYNTEETMTEESGEEESDTRKVKVMKRKAKGALKSKGKVRSLMDFHKILFMVQILYRNAVSTRPLARGRLILHLGLAFYWSSKFS